jgi:hypothetical protein
MVSIGLCTGVYVKQATSPDSPDIEGLFILENPCGLSATLARNLRQKRICFHATTATNFGLHNNSHEGAHAER